MTFRTRPTAAFRAVLAAVVLLSVAGCAGLGSAPAKADDPAAKASTAASGSSDLPRPDSTRDARASQPEGRLIATQPARVQPPLVRVRKLDLDRVRAGVQLVPQARISDLPDRLTEVDRVGKRKRLFIKTMLPAILHANQAIRAERDFVETLIALDIPQGKLPAEMRRKLYDLADKYQVDPASLETLKRRVDIVPPALVLAQAAIETGWGTSRFAQQGNAIFGEHTSDPDAPGMVPQGLEDPGFRVRAFETVNQSVTAYLRNLNTHAAYARLRAIRADARARGDYPDGPEMAAGLLDYSARGRNYVQDIRLTIRANELQQFAEARLQPAADQLVDAGSFASD